MRNFLTLTAITLLAFVTACASPAVNMNANLAAANIEPADAHPADDAPRITLADAKKEFDAGTAIFVDSRDPNAYKMEHITGAINITSAMLDDKYKDLPKDKKIIVYCS